MENAAVANVLRGEGYRYCYTNLVEAGIYYKYYQEGFHIVTVSYTHLDVYKRQCMEGDGERTSGIAWGEGIYGGRGALDE